MTATQATSTIVATAALWVTVVEAGPSRARAGLSRTRALVKIGCLTDPNQETCRSSGDAMNCQAIKTPMVVARELVKDANPSAISEIEPGGQQYPPVAASDHRRTGSRQRPTEDHGTRRYHHIPESDYRKEEHQCPRNPGREQLPPGAPRRNEIAEHSGGDVSGVRRRHR